MTGNTWSGPGRALQTHLDLFGHVDRAHDWIVANATRGVTSFRSAPATLRQRLRLMNSMAAMVTDDDLIAPLEDGHYATQANVNRGVGLINQEWEALNQGETHYVSHHIATAIEAAAEQAGDEPLFPTDPPCPEGLIVFEYPLLIPDLHPVTGELVLDLTMPVRAIAWGQNDQIYTPTMDGSGQTVQMPGIWYALYTDENAYRTLFIPSVERALPDEWESFKDFYTPPPSGTSVDRDPIWCLDSSAWSYGVHWHRSTSLSPDEVVLLHGEVHQTVAKIRRFMLALWRFCWQRILVPDTYRPTRPERRRALRAGISRLEDGYVKILRVRRILEAETRGEPTVNERDYLLAAHIRRAHPRRQWYPSLGSARNPDGSFNHDSHRLIWIDATVVGDGPPVVGHNVTAVIR